MLKLTFKEKDENGNTLFTPRAFSKRRVILTLDEEQKLRTFLRRLYTFFLLSSDNFCVVLKFLCSTFCSTICNYLQNRHQKNS